MTDKEIAPKFSREDLERFERMLRERRTRLLVDLKAIEAEEVEGASEQSVPSTHLADAASDRAASDVSLGCRESGTNEVQAIDEALERIADGSFGLCDSCDGAIALARLEAIPYARLCLSCQALEEA